MNLFTEFFTTVVLEKYATFDGRARRQEYWIYQMFYLLFYIGSMILSLIIGTRLITSIYVIAMFIPSLAVLVRRLHDTGKKGFWALISFVPLVGWIVILIFALTPGETGANEYGNDPKYSFY